MKYYFGSERRKRFRPEVIDSSMTFEEATRDCGSLICPESIRKNLVLLEILHRGFDGWVHQGQLVVHKALKDDVLFVFHRLLEEDFPIEKAVPIVFYGGDDMASMMDNNTSGFNYREKKSGGLSAHAPGQAIDINPWQNPCKEDGLWTPPRAIYDPTSAGAMTPTSLPVTLFKARGWIWGGDWRNPFDQHHFQKPHTG